MPFPPSWLSSESLSAALNSSFTTSLIGALAGAFAGAWAAQRVAERARETDRLLTQLRSTNAAITASFVVCNSFLALKQQQVTPLLTAFSAKRAELKRFHEQRKGGEIPRDQPFEFTADLRTLQMPLMPIEVLEGLVFERLSVSGRPLALTTTLAGVSASLTDLMGKRTTLIEGFKQIPSDAQSTVVALFFGLPYASGRVSTEYADTLQGIACQVDDGIFFAELLCKNLISFGEETLTAYQRLVKRTKERVGSVDFETARKSGLMPSEEHYKDWLRGFANVEGAEVKKHPDSRAA